MQLFLSQIVSGLSTGMIYACIALAIVAVFQVVNKINFAQGEIAMVSTFFAWQLLDWGLPYWAAFLLTVAVSFAGGALIERILFRPLASAPVLTNIVAFLALFAILNSIAGLIWGYTTKSFPSPFGVGPFLGSSLITRHQAGMMSVVLVLLLLLYAFFRFTRVGLAMRATAMMPESARLVGISTSRMVSVGWGIACVIGAIGGMLIAPLIYLEPNMMGGVLLYGFAAAVFGGLTSPLGAVIGGCLIGIFESMIGTYLPGLGHELKMPIALAIIVVVLVAKPDGLLGQRSVQRV